MILSKQIPEEAYLNHKGALLDMVAQFTLAQPAAAAVPESEPSARTMLSRIQLLQFSGKFEDCPAFRDLF